MNFYPLPAVVDLLPKAQTELIVMSDTHLVNTSAGHAREFASRLRQNDRISTALRVAAGTKNEALIHLGDLVQDYPENDTHYDLLATAIEQVSSVAQRVYFAPGNTDVGDKHDPSSPAAVANAATLERFGQLAGALWYSFDVGTIHGVVLSASLFNSGLSLEAEQWAWLGADLTTHDDETVVFFFHYPLFLRASDDPGVGNYDVVSDPSRARLLDLVRRHHVAAVFTGHSHFSFLNTIGQARAYGVPSTSFTRPGFSELFASCPPPDRGRDDVPKLGFHLIRLHEDGLRVHQVRTGELTSQLERSEAARPVVSCVPRDIPDSKLAVIMRHSVAQATDVPDTFPSVLPQPIRNDYPLLACLELGARYVSVPVVDTADPMLRERLQLLREEGVNVVVRVVWTSGTAPTLPKADDPVDEVELVLLDRTMPNARDLDELRRLEYPVILSTLMRQSRGGAELPRWRYGLTEQEAVALDAVLGTVRRVRLLLATPDPSVVAEYIALAKGHAWNTVQGVDLVYALDSDDDELLEHLCEAFTVASSGRGPRFFVDSLTELDRTLDLCPGLLDRACNPRASFHALRVLNSVLHADGSVKVVREGKRFLVERHDFNGLIDLGTPSSRSEEQGQVISLAEGIVVTPDEATGPSLTLQAKEQTI